LEGQVTLNLSDAAAGVGAKPKTLFDFSPKIRCCVVFSSAGKRLEVSHRGWPLTFEPDEDFTLIHEHAALLFPRRQRSNGPRGGARFVVVSSDSKVLLAYQISDKLVVVTADPDFQLAESARLGRYLERLYYWLGEDTAPDSAGPT